MRHNPTETVNIFVSKPCPHCGNLIQAGWRYLPNELVMRHEKPECAWYKKSDAGIVLKALRAAGWAGTQKKRKGRRRRRSAK